MQQNPLKPYFVLEKLLQLKKTKHWAHHLVILTGPVGMLQHTVFFIENKKIKAEKDQKVSDFHDQRKILTH